jgi:hypothetical protein
MAEGQPLYMRRRRWLEIGLLVFASFAVIFVSYKQLNVELLHAESGFFQVIAHSPREAQAGFFRSFWTTSSHGHYTPLAFSAEFFFTKWAGMHGSWWRNRQLVLGVCVTVALFLFVRAGPLIAELTPIVAWAVAGGATMLIIAQPVMRDFLQWPFHLFQLVWMILALALATAVARLPAARDKDKTIYLIAACAYASMHVLGLGLALVVATLAVFLVIMLGIRTGGFDRFRSHTRALAIASIALLILGGAHTVCMFALNSQQPNAETVYGFTWQHFFGLMGWFPSSILLNVFGKRDTLKLSAELIRSAWPFGLVLTATIFVFVCFLFRRARASSSERLESGALLAVFSTVLLLSMLIMIAKREWDEPSERQLCGYLTAARYIYPFTVAWLGLALCATLRLTALQLKIAGVAFLIFGFTALGADLEYAAEIWPRAAPLHGASNLEIWRYLLQTVQEARAGNLPIPNIPLQPMTGFAFIDLKFFEPLLRDELHINASDRFHFVEWDQCNEARRTEYFAKCPSLLRLARLFDLKPETGAAKHFSTNSDSGNL